MNNQLNKISELSIVLRRFPRLYILSRRLLFVCLFVPWIIVCTGAQIMWVIGTILKTCFTFVFGGRNFSSPKGLNNIIDWCEQIYYQINPLRSVSYSKILNIEELNGEFKQIEWDEPSLIRGEFPTVYRNGIPAKYINQIVRDTVKLPVIERKYQLECGNKVTLQFQDNCLDKTVFCRVVRIECI